MCKCVFKEGVAQEWLSILIWNLQQMIRDKNQLTKKAIFAQYYHYHYYQQNYYFCSRYYWGWKSWNKHLTERLGESWTKLKHIVGMQIANTSVSAIFWNGLSYQKETSGVAWVENPVYQKAKCTCYYYY
jgi:hypothetical protein